MAQIVSTCVVLSLSGAVYHVDVLLDEVILALASELRLVVDVIEFCPLHGVCRHALHLAPHSTLPLRLRRVELVHVLGYNIAEADRVILALFLIADTHNAAGTAQR